MSDGAVKHVGCGGSLGWNGYAPGFTCVKCGAHWDGREAGVAEYETPQAEVQNGDKA